ncbi:class I SAM-dependent methyltransferase [Sodalinema gerasimenkoae]|uniref:class I SAM-dependent methyltransferase n=1 Tax=Sodalinema gerasimenkoae TaxID=2862348 RepID=UPI00135993AC|nr:class I SAM-dependent methyltransferase [Sodalinema gerasimenkoae]
MSQLSEQVRQQFDFRPYPQIPIEQEVTEESSLLFSHEWQTPHYLQTGRVPEPKTARILDAGCGTGYGTLALATANPGAEVLGVDFSAASLEKARSRLDYHGHHQVELHCLDLMQLHELGIQFDYINCDDTLYLFDDPIAALGQLQEVLKPGGILRVNVHSALQREAVYRGQTLFHRWGLLEENPETPAVETLQGVMGQLKGWVNLKQQTWKPEFAREEATADILMNYLFQGDRGYTIPKVFEILEQAGLQFLRMVNWQQWDLLALFNQPQSLPPSILEQLRGMSVQQQLEWFELLHPVHRLLDFWCVNTHHPPADSVANWDAVTWANQWSQVQVWLHPQLCHDGFRDACLQSWHSQKPLLLNAYFDPGLNGVVTLDSRGAISLFPLIKTSPQPLLNLIRRSIDLFPRHPETLEPVQPELVLAQVKTLLVHLHHHGCVFLEHQPNEGRQR